MKNLEHIYQTLSVKHKLPLNDFPKTEDLRNKLDLIPWETIKQVPKKDLDRIQKIFFDDLPQITALLPGNNLYFKPQIKVKYRVVWIAQSGMGQVFIKDILGSNLGRLKGFGGISQLSAKLAF